MKLISTFVTVTTLCLSFGFSIGLNSVTISALAQSSADTATEQTPAEQRSETSESGQFTLLEIPNPGLLTEDTNALNSLADQINQDVNGRSERFLPDGMVVRGSGSSLQLGSEL